jgi:prolyl oligopeptidase
MFASYLLAAGVLFASTAIPGTASAQSVPVTSKVSYPAATRSGTEDTYHNTKVADPYRWMEQLDSADTLTWLKSQANLTRKYIDGIAKRQEIVKLTRETLDFERCTVPVAVAGKFFYLKNDGLQEQAVIYRADGLNGKAEVVLDPNKLWPDGLHTLKNYAVSGDGKYLAYSASVYGADVTEWKVRDLANGSDFTEIISAQFSSPSWSPHLSGFYYSKGRTIYFHTVGTDPSQDQSIYTTSEDYADGRVTSTGRYLLIKETSGVDPKARVSVRDLVTSGRPVTGLFPMDAAYDYICEKDGTLWFATTLKAPKGSIIKMNLSDTAHYTEVVAEDTDTLESVRYAGGYLFANYLHDACSVVKVFKLDGTLVRELELPGKGTANSFIGDGTANGVLYGYSNFVTPYTIFRFDTKDVEKGKSTVWYCPKPAYDTTDFVQEQVSYKSKDGTRVPMTLAYRKGIAKDGSNPVWLYAYGGFHINILPQFDPYYATWMRLGGIVAVPNIRGGSEFGEAWHDGGIKQVKQNCFDDFRAAAHYLIDEGYTSKGKIAINGASNGGLLVGACLTQEPDLFGAALPQFGVLDMIRFGTLGGSSWMSDYGNPGIEDEFKALYAYSPLHNVRKGTKYPAVLVITADHDDRVVPSHSYKFTAALQYAQAPENPPIMLLVLKNAGHLYGRTTAKMIDFTADRYAFVLNNLR